MSATPIDRDALAAILERYGDTLSSFDNLRPDSYEHALACQSLEHLEHFYSVILEPGKTQVDVRGDCPAWPSGTKFAGQRPSTNVISTVSERLRTASALRQIRPVGKFLEEFSREVKATPLGQSQAILDAMIGALGQKLMADVRDGKPISENLKLVDKLQAQRVIEQNETKLKQNAEKITHDDRRIKVLEAKLAEAQEAKRKIEAALISGKSQGGLTPETLRQIEEATKLL